MKAKNKHSFIFYLPLFVLLMLHIVATPQEIILDTEFGIQPVSIAVDHNNDIILTAMTNDTTYFWQSMIIKISPDMDTTIKIINDTLNELFGPLLLVTQNNRYIVNAVEDLEGGSNWADRLTIIVFDEFLNILSFKRYNMEHIHPAVDDTHMLYIQNEDGRIFGFGIRGDNNDFLTMEITEMGDTLRTHLIHSGPVYPTLFSDVIESHNDSIAYYAFIAGFDYYGAWKVLTVDTAFNYSYSDIVLDPGYNDIQGVRANWINDSIYMGVGFFPLNNGDKDIGLYKANAYRNHEVLSHPPLWIYRQDTVDTPAINIPTFVDQNHVYVGSYRGSNPGASYNGRYMVAIVDEELNLIGMKSLGKDGYQYDMTSLQATDDLGCIVTGTVHDNANAPSYDWDLFVRKIMPEDIVEVAEKTEDPDDSDYFLYPNPGTNNLYVKTARNGVLMKIINGQGEVVLQQYLIKGVENSIDVKKLPSGTFVLHFVDKDGFSENLIWIKI